MQENEEDYAVKRFSDIRDAEKIRALHDQLQAIQYPYCLPVTKKGNAHIVIQPWLTDSVPVNFSKKEERTASLTTLVALHETEVFVDWESLPFLKPYALLDKWRWRLYRFRSHRDQIEKFLGSETCDEIEQYAEHALMILQTASVRAIPNTLLHGDVVHHNLLKTPDGSVYLIDFDLACTGHPDIEIGLWLHRVLPKVDYDAMLLFSEQPRLQELGEQPIAMLQYPNELLREWSYLATLPEARQNRLADHLLPFTERALNSWPELCRFSNNLLDFEP
ncbi:phosphotransferase [Sporosarcina sp. A2]|uniref:phosphotransferase n=1 Tax=Sporosarcina sp. A2 TaxID=3393449 RepID=UPI003D791711